MKLHPRSLCARLLAAALAVAGPACDGSTGPGAEAELTVLFIGNSLTASNDLPSMTQAVAAAGGRTLDYGARTADDTSLEDHWYSGVAAIIANARADVVVLQQGPSSLPESQQHLKHWTGQLAGPIAQAGGQPALFMVWPDATRAHAFDDVYASYRGAADAVGGFFIPAGRAWQAVWQRFPEAGLYGPDGFHPSTLGSLVAALTIYAVLFDADVRALPRSVAPGIAAADVDAILGAVHEAVTEPGSL